MNTVRPSEETTMPCAATQTGMVAVRVMVAVSMTMRLDFCRSGSPTLACARRRSKCET
nr:hypothetical protein [Deltaproteobacteria bacterium]